MTTYFKELNVQGWENISQMTLDYVKKENYIFKRSQGRSFIFLPAYFLNDIKPVVDRVFSSYKIKCINAAIYVMTKSEHGSLHSDNAKDNYRINLPVLNTDNTYTRFYQVSKKVYFENSRYKIKIPANDSINTLVDSIEITRPTLIDVNAFHEIIMDETHSPRITLTLFFDRDLKFLLD